jgi:hypothetical protein
MTIVVLFLLGPLLSGLVLSPHPTLAASPSIILINTDDLDSDSLRFMPNVESLVIGTGASFTDFIVAAPDCCPSRVSLLRGQYVHNHGILRGSKKFGEGKFRSRGLEDSTIATWLRRADYRTALIGKYLNGYENDPTYVPPGWTEWDATVSNQYFDYQINENGKLVRYGSDPADYQTDVLSQKSVSFIQHSATAGKRFFLYLTPSAPHGLAMPAPRHASLFAEKTAPRTASFNEEDVSDKPSYIQAASPITQSDIDTIDERYRNRIRSLQAVDEMVAEIVTTLQDTGTLSNSTSSSRPTTATSWGSTVRRTRVFRMKRRSRFLSWSGAQGLRPVKALVSFRPTSTWLRPSRIWRERQFPASFPAAPSFRCFKDRNPEFGGSRQSRSTTARATLSPVT